MFDDPKVLKLVVYGLAGVCAVLFLAVIFLAVKKNIYYVDEYGNELPPKARKRMKQEKAKPPVENPVQPKIQEKIDEEPQKPIEEKKFSVIVSLKIGNKEEQYEIDSFPCLIGRESDSCDLVVNEPAVSRKHIVLKYEEGKLLMEDLAEHNGTFLNGIKVPTLSTQTLHVNDKIQLGRAEMGIESIHE